MIINIDVGTFAGGDKSCNKYYATSLAKSGYIATTLNYNYLPEVNLKKQVQDCMTAINEITEKYNQMEI